MVDIKTPGHAIVTEAAQSRSKTAVDIKQMRKRDSKLVKGRFHHLERPGTTKTITYKKYKGDPVMRYKLQDGEECRIPVGLANHINEEVGYYENQYLLDAAGRPSKLAKRRKRTCSFELLEFMDVESVGDPRKDDVKITELPSLKRK